MNRYNIKRIDIYLSDPQCADTEGHVAHIRMDIRFGRMMFVSNYYLDQLKFHNFFTSGIYALCKLIQFFHPPERNPAYPLPKKPLESLQLLEREIEQSKKITINENKNFSGTL